MLAPDRLAEFKGLRKTDASEVSGELARFDARRFGPILELAVEKDGKGVAGRLGHRETQLKPPPHGAIEEFGVVRSSDRHHIARQLIDLHQQKRHDAFDLAGLVNVTALLADRIEFVKEENARHRACVVEQACEASISLAEIRADQRIISDGEELHCKRFSDPFCDGGFPVAGRTRQQHAVPWLHAMSTQQVGAVLFFDKLLDLLAHRQRKDQLVQSTPGRALKDRILAGLATGKLGYGRCDGDGTQRPL
jgi:hypothetical protein